jgi:hypothetical protein
LLPAAETQLPAADATLPAASNPVANAAPPRAAYLETSLPNEDLESILQMRRQAMANSRLVSNQYYPSTTPPQAAETRSWTYNPNTAPNTNVNPNVNSTNMPAANPNVNSWTLPQANNAQAMPGAYNGLPSRNSVPLPPSGLNIDPEYARQLGYGQPNANPQTNISGNVQNQVGWWNAAAAQARNNSGSMNPASNLSGVPANSGYNNFSAPNIAAPSGSMMAPASGYMIPNNPSIPNNQQPVYDYSNRNMPAGYPAGTVR